MPANLLIVGFGLAGLAVLTNAILAWVGSNPRKVVYFLLGVGGLFLFLWLAPGVSAWLVNALKLSVCR
jgi:hypothetical protein